MKSLLLASLVLSLSLSGCAGIAYKLTPPASLEPAWQQGHSISHIEPVVAAWVQFWPFNYTRWEGEETFRTFSICLGGLPVIGMPKVRCLQTYWGVKVDGTESHALQATDPTAWDYVYTPSEQWAFRLHGVGAPNVYDMGGS